MTKKKQKTSKFDAKASEYIALIEATRSKNDKTLFDKLIILVNDITSKVFLPTSCWFSIPVGIIALIVGSAIDNSIVSWCAGGVLAHAVYDIVYYSINKPC